MPDLLEEPFDLEPEICSTKRTASFGFLGAYIAFFKKKKI